MVLENGDLVRVKLFEDIDPTGIPEKYYSNDSGNEFCIGLSAKTINEEHSRGVREIMGFRHSPEIGRSVYHISGSPWAFLECMLEREEDLLPSLDGEEFAALLI